MKITLSEIFLQVYFEPNEERHIWSLCQELNAKLKVAWNITMWHNLIILRDLLADFKLIYATMQGTILL
jgi:hypothetical protein